MIPCGSQHVSDDPKNNYTGVCSDAKREYIATVHFAKMVAFQSIETGEDRVLFPIQCGHLAGNLKPPVLMVSQRVNPILTVTTKVEPLL